MEEEPNFHDTPERKFPGETEREKFSRETSKEYMDKVDDRLDLIKRQRARKGFSFILKYIGAWYIVLSIFKGLFYKFSPSFDIIGLLVFLSGYVVEAHHTKLERKEEEAEERNDRIKDD